MLKRPFSSVGAGPSTSSIAIKAESSSSPTHIPQAKARRVAAPYPLPNACNDPPFCPRHDFYPPSSSHLEKYGQPPCGKGCAAAMEDGGSESEEEVRVVRDDKGKGKAREAQVKPEPDLEDDFVSVHREPQAVPKPVVALPAAPAPAQAPAHIPAALNLPAPVPVPAWINGSHTLYVPATRFIRKQLGGWCYRSTSAKTLLSGQRQTSYRCTGNLRCTSCGNVTRCQSTLTCTRAQCAKKCSLCEDEVGTLYRVDCEARAKKVTTIQKDVVKIEWDGEHSCSHAYGGGHLVKKNPYDEDERRVNVGALPHKA
ncbi:hypothetical protein P7C70_g6074, partial [Phenoliferia sp. Uapishka_3]